MQRNFTDNAPSAQDAPALVIQSAATAEINRLNGEIYEHARTSIAKAVRIGELLTQTRTLLKHGEWLLWLRDNVHFSDRTARNYVHAYERGDQVKLETVSSLRELYNWPAAESELENFVRSLYDACTTIHGDFGKPFEQRDFVDIECSIRREWVEKPAETVKDDFSILVGLILSLLVKSWIGDGLTPAYRREFYRELFSEQQRSR